MYAGHQGLTIKKKSPISRVSQNENIENTSVVCLSDAPYGYSEYGIIYFLVVPNYSRFQVYEVQ